MNRLRLISIYILTVVGFSIVCPIAGAAPPLKAPKTLSFQWKPARGASGYIFQLRDPKGKILINQKGRANSAKIDLPEGRYQYRITALNKFSKPSRWSPWASFRIRRSRFPFIRTGAVSMTRTVRTTRNKKGKIVKIPVQRIVIKGRNFTKSTKVNLITKDGRKAKARLERQDDNTLVLVVDVGKVKPGQYDLVVENPGSRVLRKPRYLAMVTTKKGTSRIAKIDGRKANKDGIIKQKKIVKIEKKSGKDPRTAFHRPEKGAKTGDGSTSGTVIRTPTGWQILVPGLPQYKSKENWKAYAYPGSFVLFAGLGYSQWQKANAAATEASNQLFLNPLVLGPLSTSGMVNGNTLSILTMNALFEKESLAREHNIARRNQAIIGGAALLTYMLHAYDVSLSSYSWQQLAPGLPSFKSGSYWSGSLWIGTFALAAGAGFYEYNRANQIAAKTDSDLLISSYSNPLLYQAIHKGTLDEAGLNEMFYMSSLLKSADEAAYKAARRNQSIIGGTAALIYIAHLFFAGAGPSKGLRTQKEKSKAAFSTKVIPYFSFGKGNARRAGIGFFLTY